MEIVKPTANLETLNKNIKDDFYKVPNLSFDIEKLRAMGFAKGGSLDNALVVKCSKLLNKE